MQVTITLCSVEALITQERHVFFTFPELQSWKLGGKGFWESLCSHETSWAETVFPRSEETIALLRWPPKAAQIPPWTAFRKIAKHKPSMVLHSGGRAGESLQVKDHPYLCNTLHTRQRYKTGFQGSGEIT